MLAASLFSLFNGLIFENVSIGNLIEAILDVFNVSYDRNYRIESFRRTYIPFA